ncbi:restriction endonuclease subunit S, partial [Marinospirillum sp.]|uniref:restriction endonuclease subunit S n=1 Tax=Marinospirillum sp. TaxID=2183934 RepID=UPI00286FBB01
DILMAMTGGTVGKSYLVEVLPEPMVVNQRVATVKILAPIYAKYIYFLLKTKSVREVIENAKNSTNDNISMKDIQSFLVPLPPTKEQHRIVQKVDELMTLCDRLKERLNQASETHNQLAEAVVEGALN